MRIIYIVIVVLLIGILIINNLSYKEQFTKMIENTRAEYNKQRRYIRRTSNDATQSLRSQVNRTLRQAGF